nr:hypothetical protein [Tanacetum cinerariifolium]
MKKENMKKSMLKDTKHKDEGKGDAKMTDAGCDDGTQQTTYEQVKDDEHVILTIFHDTQKTKVPLQSSYISSDFANQFLNLDNVPPTDSEVISMMNIKVRHEEQSTKTPLILIIPVTVILKTSTTAEPIISLIIPSITPLPQQSTPTPTPAPTTEPTTTSIHALLDFSSLFKFDQRVSVLKKELSQLKHNTFRSYTIEFEKKAKNKRKRYKDLVEKSVKDIIKDEVKSQLPQILPNEVFEFTTLVIQSTITESLDNVILDKSSSQLKSTYEAAASLIGFELKKILLDKIDHEDKDKDEDHPAGLDQGLKKRKTSKDAKPSKGSKSKESKSSSSKGTKSQKKSSGKSAQAEESVFESVDTEMPHNQGGNLGKTDVQPNTTSDLDQQYCQSKKPPLNFDKLMSTPIDFSAYVMNNLKIENLTQEHLVGPAFNLLKGTCRSRVELEYYFEECYKAITDRLDWNNSEGQEYPLKFSKPLSLIEDRGRQVVPVNYFINNDLGYLKGGSSSRIYTTSTTKPRLLSMMIFKASKTSFHRYGVQRRTDISKTTPYTTYNNPQEIIYQNKFKRNRLMRSDELYKFCDGTLTSVRSVLHDIASSLRMDYLQKRR